MGQSPNSKNYTNNPRDNILVQGNADLYNNRVLKRTFTTEVTKIADRNDILISVRAPVGDIARNQYESIVIGRGIAAIKGNNFLYYQLEKMNNSGFWKKYIAGSTFESITGKDLKSSDIYISNHKEEKSIGDIFQTLTKTIQLHERKCEELALIKQALLQKFFPKKDEIKPEVRYKNFSDAWEQRKLRKTNTFFTDGNYGEAYPKQSDMTNSNDGVPFLTGGNLKDGQIDITDVNYITKKKHGELTSGHLIEDDIIIAVRGSLGALGYVNKKNIDWNINSQLAILRTNKTELIGKYLLQFLLSSRGQIELTKKQTGSALKQLPIKALKDINIPITSIKEQQEIGAFFQQLDSLIALHQRKLEKLKQLKKFLLQNMFI